MRFHLPRTVKIKRGTHTGKIIYYRVQFDVLYNSIRCVMKLDTLAQYKFTYSVNILLM
jgi:hypothetical protein